MAARRNRVASVFFAVASHCAETPPPLPRGISAAPPGAHLRGARFPAAHPPRPLTLLDPGIILVARLLVSRAGGIKSPQSPTYQQAEAKMKSEREKIPCFLLLLFLSRRAGRVEIRHGTVVAFDLRARPCCRPLAHGHWIRLGATASPSRRVHHSLICRSAKLAVKRTGNDLATRVGAPRVHQRGADSPMPERMVI